MKELKDWASFRWTHSRAIYQLAMYDNESRITKDFKVQKIGGIRILVGRETGEEFSFELSGYVTSCYLGPVTRRTSSVVHDMLYYCYSLTPCTTALTESIPTALADQSPLQAPRIHRLGRRCLLSVESIRFSSRVAERGNFSLSKTICRG